MSLLAHSGDGTTTAAAPGQDLAVERSYFCADGTGFTVRFEARRATIRTRAHRYVLSRRPFSVGVRYGSDEVAFALDEDRAVLVGAADGPYRDCIERQPERAPRT